MTDFEKEVCANIREAMKHLEEAKESFSKTTKDEKNRERGGYRSIYRMMTYVEEVLSDAKFMLTVLEERDHIKVEENP